MKSRFINKTIYKHERSTILTMLIWATLISALMIVTMSMFPLISRAVRSLPEDIRAYLGPMDNVNMYFESQASEIWALLLCVYGAVLVYKLVTKELKGKSCEIVYTSPASRGEIIRTKALRIFINISLMNIIIAAFAFMSLYIWGSAYNLVHFLVYTFVVWLVAMIVTYLIFGISLLFNQKMSALPIFVILIAFYILMSFYTNLPTLGYFTPMSVLGGGIIEHGFYGVRLYGMPIVIWLVICVVTNIVGFCKFRKSDLC